MLCLFGVSVYELSGEGDTNIQTMTNSIQFTLFYSYHHRCIKITEFLNGRDTVFHYSYICSAKEVLDTCPFLFSSLHFGTVLGVDSEIVSQKSQIYVHVCGGRQVAK